MAHFLPPELVRQVNKLEWPKSIWKLLENPGITGLEIYWSRMHGAPLNSPAALSNVCREDKDLLVSIKL